jgi:hypothetical protein
VRPLVRSLYAIALDEPLGAEFGCSGRFASNSLEQDNLKHESARFAIDLWLRTEAAAERFPIGQIWRPISAPVSRATLRDVVHQVVLAVIESLRAHESFWRNANAISDLRTWGTDPGVIPDITPWDFQALAEQARRDIVEITPLLEDVLDPGLFVGVMDNVNGGGLRLDDELWVRTVFGFATAIQHGRAALDHMADMFVPLYMWRAAAFMSDTAPEPPAAVQTRLDALCDTFLRLKPTLVTSWLNEV